MKNIFMFQYKYNSFFFILSLFYVHKTNDCYSFVISSLFFALVVLFFGSYPFLFFFSKKRSCWFFFKIGKSDKKRFTFDLPIILNFVYQFLYNETEQNQEQQKPILIHSVEGRGKEQEGKRKREHKKNSEDRREHKKRNNIFFKRLSWWISKIQ